MTAPPLLPEMGEWHHTAQLRLLTYTVTCKPSVTATMAIKPMALVPVLSRKILGFQAKMLARETCMVPSSTGARLKGIEDHTLKL
jgi:hypothetical protein